MRIPESTLSEIQNRLDLAEVVGEYVALQRKGGRYWGLCPFHQEKSPSFSVTSDKGVYYCFGCHKGGGLFQFIMEVEKLQWRDAVELLARKAGVEIPQGEAGGESGKREALLELNKRIAGTFHWLLCEGPQADAARAYLAGRGVTRDTIDGFQLGFAPLDREWLHRFLLQKSYSEEFLSQTGLFMQGSRSGTATLFANRVVFPIANARGETLAFGGRALGDAQPKYLNSPETAFFRKGENLFAIDKAAAAIRSAGAFILVEGYMDVLAMHQAGISNCVAPLGTALTESQVRLLKRHAQKGILVFDGDEAGQKATMRAVELLERQDLIAQVVELPEGMDPADFVQKGEIEKLREVLKRPLESFRYLSAKAAAWYALATPEGREGMRDFLFPFVAAVSSQLRADGYLSQIADSLSTEPDAIRRDFTAWRARGRRGKAKAADVQELSSTLSADLFLLLAVAANRDLFPIVRTGGISLSDFDDERARALFIALEECFRTEETGLDSLCARIESSSLRDLVIRKIASGEFDLNQEKMVRDGVRRVRQRELVKKRDQLGAEMRKMEHEGSDTVRLRELLAEKMHLDDELAKLSTGAARV
jgi:DNA primase